MARDIAATYAYITSRRERKKVEMLFAHLKRILRLDRLRLRGPNGARDEFHLYPQRGTADHCIERHPAGALCARRHAAGGMPYSRLNARLKAASDS